MFTANNHWGDLTADDGMLVMCCAFFAYNTI